MSGVELNDRVESWAIDPAASSRLRQRRWLSLAIMLVVFCSGAAIGSGLTTISIENNRKNIWQNQNQKEARERMLTRLRSDLDLSDPQSEKIEQILEKHDQAVKKVWAGTWPEMRTLFKQLDEQIAGALTADQQPQWHAWLEKRKNRVCPPPSHASKHPRHRDGRHHEGQHVEGQSSPSHASNDATEGEASRPQRPE